MSGGAIAMVHGRVYKPALKVPNPILQTSSKNSGTREGYSGKQCFRADFIDFQLKLDDEIMQLLAEFDKNLKHYFISFCSLYYKPCKNDSQRLVPCSVLR